MVGKPRPNIFELIEVIKKEEATTKMKMHLYESGAKEPPWRRKVRGSKGFRLCFRDVMVEQLASTSIWNHVNTTLVYRLVFIVATLCIFYL